MTNELKNFQSHLTPYFNNQLEKKYSGLPSHLQTKMLQEAYDMSKIGVESEEDHKDFIYILRHAKSIGEELTQRSLSRPEVAHLANEMYKLKNISSPKSILGLYQLARQALQELKIPIKKIAYPIGDSGGYTESPHNLQKWMVAMRSYYFLRNQGYPLSYSFNIATKEWDDMEREDFKHWLSFYQENGHTKYKTAQINTEPRYYQAGEGAMIPLDHLKAKLPGMPDMSQYQDRDLSLLAEQQNKKQEAENFIKAIVGRLNAAERLITKPEVQTVLKEMLRMGLPEWLEALHRLKREIQTAPIQARAALKNLKIKDINTQATNILIQDLLFKEANILLHQGKIASAKFMIKIAQEAIPNAPIPSNQGQGSNVAPPSMLSSDSDDGSEAIKQLIEGMNNQKDDASDSNNIEDMEEDPLSEITIIAQAIPPGNPNIEVKDEILGNPEPSPEINIQPKRSEEPEVTEQHEAPSSKIPDEIIPSQIEKPNLTDPFEIALADITVIDVISRLEALANVFRNREISRQLAIIDLMMDRLSIASFFPSLAEASSKSLESNQYALTRIEDILSKIRGSVETPSAHKVDLSGPIDQAFEPVPNAPTEEVKQNLIQNQEQEKARKQRRKDLEEAKEQSQINNIPEELAQPVNIQEPNVQKPVG